MEDPIQAPIQIPIPRKVVLVINGPKRKNMTATDNHDDDGIEQSIRNNNQGSVLSIVKSQNIPTQTQQEVPIPFGRRRSIKRKTITRRVADHDDDGKHNAAATSFRKRSRKGVPHRSPLK